MNGHLMENNDSASKHLPEISFSACLWLLATAWDSSPAACLSLRPSVRPSVCLSSGEDRVSETGVRQHILLSLSTEGSEAACYSLSSHMACLLFS